MLLRKIILCTWCIVRPRNPLIYNYSILSSKPYVFTKSFFTSQQLLLASKKKASLKESGKKGKSYAKEEVEEEIINISEEKRNLDLNKIETKITTAVEKLKREFSSMRLGRANPAILDPITVPFKDGSAPLKDIAQIIVKDPQTLLVHVHEEELLKEVDKAIRSANLNLNPMVEGGKSLKVPIPKITTEFREKMTKVASKIAESAKVKIRLVRQEGMKDLKNGRRGLSSDEVKILDKKLQFLIEKSVKEVDEILRVKTKEILGN